MPNTQAKGEVFIPQKIKSSTSKLEISSLLWVIFALLYPVPDQPTKMNADPDPDPQQWNLHSFTPDSEQPPTYLQNPSSGIRSRYL
jgi:hypothetical protein